MMFLNLLLDWPHRIFYPTLAVCIQVEYLRSVDRPANGKEGLYVTL